MIFKGKANEFLQLQKIHSTNCYRTTLSGEMLWTFLWFERGENDLTIDGVEYSFSKDQVVCLNEFHKVGIADLCHARMLRFNRSMFCVLDNDKDIGCKGLLFLGSQRVPWFSIEEKEKHFYDLVWRRLEEEVELEDQFQRDILQLLLKRFALIATNSYKRHIGYSDLNKGQVDILREYNFLVEEHFKTKHHVADYAKLLNKSPKTLSNLFSKVSEKTPLQYIQDRILLEAQRFLLYSEKQVTEIAYNLGFEDLQTFGRFFKNKAGVSPTEFRETKKDKTKE